MHGDGDSDVIIYSQTNTTIGWFENDGLVAPSFTRHEVETDSVTTLSVGAEDIHGDGEMDIYETGVFFNNFGKVVWYPNDAVICPSHIVDATAPVGGMISMQCTGGPWLFYVIAVSDSTGPSPRLGGILIDLGMNYVDNNVGSGVLDGSGQAPVFSVVVPVTLTCGSTGYSPDADVHSHQPGPERAMEHRSRNDVHVPVGH